MTIGQQAIQMALLISAPMLLAALAIGFIISVLQAATQINEMTLSFIPKLLGVFGVLVDARVTDRLYAAALHKHPRCDRLTPCCKLPIRS
jgi:type III secretory pathway component EscS